MTYSYYMPFRAKARRSSSRIQPVSYAVIYRFNIIAHTRAAECCR